MRKPFPLHLGDRVYGPFTLSQLRSFERQIKHVLTHHYWRPSNAPSAPPELSPFIRALARETGFTVSAITSPFRGKAPVAWARMSGQFIARGLFPLLTVREIGAAFNRDHSSVSYSTSAVSDRCDVDAGFRAELESLRARTIARMAERIPQSALRNPHLK